MTENEDDCELEQRFQSSRGVRILSCKQTRVSRPRPTNTNTTITQPQDSNQHGNALAPCLRVILDSEALRWVQAGHPRYTGCPKGKAVGGPHETTSDKNDTDKRQDKRAFSETGVDCTDQVLTHTWESYMVEEPHSFVEENVVNRVEVEKTRSHQED